MVTGENVNIVTCYYFIQITFIALIKVVLFKIKKNIMIRLTDKIKKIKNKHLKPTDSTDKFLGEVVSQAYYLNIIGSKLHLDK